MSVLRLVDVVKHYFAGGQVVRAVDGVSLVVSPGELVGVYGPSGSGKTTLLQIVAGLSPPDTGSVQFGELEIPKLSARESARYRLREVGVVFQSFHLIGGASALDNAAVKLIAEGCSMREAKRRAEPWLIRVGLGERLHQPAAKLSMGERQRVAIARALTGEPRLLLADEPTGNLDTERSCEVLTLLRDVCDQQQIAGLLVTHDPLAKTFVSAVYTLRDGCLRTGLNLELAAPAR
jgi:putative ABC transport system ATP-binding protein